MKMKGSPENWPPDREGREFKVAYYRYPPVRDVVFVLGAGASCAEGAPLQKGIIPLIMGDDMPEIRESSLGKLIVEFIQDNFGCDLNLSIYPSMEAVFGFLDYFIQGGVSLSSKYTDVKLHYIKEGLIKLIHYVFAAATKESTRNIYRRFWKLIAEYNLNISVVTLNYDTLLEDAFASLYPEKAYIDFQIPLMNYCMPEEARGYSRWIDPSRPFPVWEGCNPVPVKIMKVHGSINWKYCRCCNGLLLTPWDKDINLDYEAFPRFFMTEEDGASNSELIEPVKNIYTCPADSTRFETLIIPPAHSKNLSNPIISQLMNASMQEMARAKRVVFIGYSFSDADIHLRAVLGRALSDRDKPFTVINVDDSPEYRIKFQPLSDNVEFISDSFENTVESGDLLRKILMEAKEQ